MENRIIQRMQEPGSLLSIYFTAGFPRLDDTVRIIEALQDSGVDMIEIGLPFSDPLADGPTIQQSSLDALRNGMRTALLFRQLEGIRARVHIPLIVMGYFNPMLQFGVEEFCARCAGLGIDGIIMPDLPLAEFQESYQSIYERHGLLHISLITPQTSDARIREIDEASRGFIYMVSTASTTGARPGFGQEQEDYFSRIASMGLKNPLVVGFGVSNSETYGLAARYTRGAIVGSAFVRFLRERGIEAIPEFVQAIRPEAEHHPKT